MKENDSFFLKLKVNKLNWVCINVKYDENHAIGKRYRRHDEAGTPYCITVDGQTKEDGTVTIRDRDTMSQERIFSKEAIRIVQERLVNS